MSKAYDIVMESRKDVVDKLISQMEKGYASTRALWSKTLTGRPYNPVSEAVYRGGNRFRLMIAAEAYGYTDPRWMTFKQASEKNYKVAPGAKGVLLEKWIFHKDVPKLDENEKPVIGADGKPEMERVPLEKPIVNYFRVFNGDQIIGLPELEHKVFDEDYYSKTAEIFEQSSKCPILYEYQDRAYYSPTEDKIHLPPKESFKNNETRLSVLLHEMAHSTGHESRLNRDIKNTFGSVEYAKEELNAELSSVFLETELGISMDPDSEMLKDHANYVKSWISVMKDNPNELFIACANAESITEYLMKGYEQELEVQKIHNENVQQNSLTDRVKIANEALSKTPHWLIDRDGYSNYVNEDVTEAMLSREEAEMALSKGIHIGAIAEIEDYHGSHEDQYQFETIANREKLDRYIANLKFKDDLRISIDPAYEYSHIGEAALQLSEMKTYIQEIITNRQLVEAMDLLGYELIDTGDNKISFRRMDDYLNQGDTQGWTFQYDTWSEVRKTFDAPRLWEKPEVTDKVSNLVKSWDESMMSKQEVEFVKEHEHLLRAVINKPEAKQTVVINAFGGAGAGKTTACLEIAEKLKKAGYVTEYVQEYAKELVWEQDWEKLDGSQAHQFEILQEQLRRMDRLYGKVDFIVTDAPVFLNAIYNNELTEAYDKMLVDLYSQYNNFNFIMERDVSKFEVEGRMQNLEESIQKDGEIQTLLDKKGLYYGVYNHSTVEKIVSNAITTHNRLVQAAEKNIQEENAKSEQTSPLEDDRTVVAIESTEDYAEPDKGFYTYQYSDGRQGVRYRLVELGEDGLLHNYLDNDRFFIDPERIQEYIDTHENEIKVIGYDEIVHAAGAKQLQLKLEQSLDPVAPDATADYEKLKERYTEALKLAGYRPIEDPLDLLSFEKESSGEVLRMGDWQVIGQELENMQPINDTDRERYEKLIHPEGRIEYFTRNLNGQGLNDDYQRYEKFDDALEAYRNAGIVDGKTLGFTITGTADVDLIWYNAREMENVLYRVSMRPENYSPECTLNELDQLRDHSKLALDILQKDNAYIQLVQSVTDLEEKFVSNIENDIAEDLMGRFASMRRPQDYFEISLTHSNDAMNVKLAVREVHANEVINEKSISRSISVLSSKGVSAFADKEFAEWLKEEVSNFDTDYMSMGQRSFTLYSSSNWESVENHYEKLARAGYDMNPTYSMSYDYSRIESDIEKHGFQPTDELTRNIAQLERLEGRRLPLKELANLSKENGHYDHNPDKKELLNKIVGECKHQEMEMATNEELPSKQNNFLIQEMQAEMGLVQSI